MSDNCPKCEAVRTKFEGQTSWECGSYQSLIGGSHIRTPQFKLIESEHCKTKQALTARESELAEAKRRVAELEKLKSAIAWVRREIEWHANETTDFQMSAAYHCVLEITRVLIDADRTTHIPGKEDNDGETH